MALLNLNNHSFIFSDPWPFLERSKRDSEKDPMMPVVFLPQASQTECERVSRMSSWGFMSFVLAAVNAVINISNNINNNNNNRNNNNNDDNNNEYNANIGNTNNVQMAGGMAMSKRRRTLPLALQRIKEIRSRFQRKYGYHPPQIKNTMSVLKVPENVSESDTGSENEATKLLEKLYQTEIVEKEKTKESVRKQVSELITRMYEEQSQHHQQRLQKRHLEDSCSRFTEDIVDQSSFIALLFIELWVEVDLKNYDHSETQNHICKIMKKSQELGEIPRLVAQSILNHLEFVLNEKFSNCFA